MVKLPSYEWFMGLYNFKGKGNTYSGSFGCDPVIGNAANNILRYSAWFDKLEDGYEMTAAYWIGPYAYDSTDEDIITKKIFEASTEGISQAQSWIQGAADDYYKNINGAE